jgi:type IV pilus assembly protein PilW
MSNLPRISVRGARFNQRGLTLIEMAISMVIAMFLLAGLTTVVMGIRTSFGTQTQLAQLQDNERLAMTMLTDVIQQTGYYPSAGITNSATVALPVSTNFAIAGQAITGTTSATAPGDKITVRYAMVSTDGIFNCAGGTSSSATLGSYESQFSVVVTNGIGTLQCTTTVDNGASTTVPLVSGVTNMKIMYGVNTTGATATCADSYLTSDEVTNGSTNFPKASGGFWYNSATNGSNVCSVKITLTFTNPIDPKNPIQFTRVIALMSNAGANT